MRKPLVLALFLLTSAAGVAVIALPDSGPRLAISEAHGPGLLDSAGILLLLLSSSIIFWYVYKHRQSLAAAPRALRTASLFAAGLGTGLVVASVANDFSAWWAVGAGLLAATQLTLFALADSHVDKAR